MRKKFKSVDEFGKTVSKFEGLNETYDIWEYVHDIYRITEHRSIFTKRSDKRDIYIQREQPPGKQWGALIDGKFYDGVVWIACEDGHVVRGAIEFVPAEILDNLETWGFTYGGNNDNSNDS